MSSSSYHWTDNLLMNPEDEERKAEKEVRRLLAEDDIKIGIATAQFGIPTTCPCGGNIKPSDASPNPKSKNDFDTLPGLRYFTCANFKDDGFHFRQPWVLGVEQEIGKLSRQIEKQNETIETQNKMIEQMRKEIQNLTQEIATMQQHI